MLMVILQFSQLGASTIFFVLVWFGNPNILEAFENHEALGMVDHLALSAQCQGPVLVLLLTPQTPKNQYKTETWVGDRKDVLVAERQPHGAVTEVVPQRTNSINRTRGEGLQDE